MGLQAGTKLGNYEIGAPLGAGGMGEVYRAKDLSLQREVAIKILPASFSQDADHTSSPSGVSGPGCALYFGGIFCCAGSDRKRRKVVCLWDQPPAYGFVLGGRVEIEMDCDMVSGTI